MNQIERYLEMAMTECLKYGTTIRTRRLWESVHHAEKMLRNEYRWRVFDPPRHMGDYAYPPGDPRRRVPA